MLWINLLILLPIIAQASEKDDSNDIAVPPPPVKLDSTLRKALLKALTELENEEDRISDDDRSIEKVPASSFTILAKSSDETVASATTTEQPTTTPSVTFQKSDTLPTTSITSFERQELDPLKDADEIITSATSSITTSKISPSQNSIVDDVKSKTQKPETTTLPTSTITTTTISTTSTEENEAKVEQVQLFSAPLVAAFTVHQDEQGQPKKVEPIFKQESSKKEEEAGKVDQQKDLDKLRQQKKQKALEEEILHLRQQELYFKQQLLQQEQLRLRNNAQTFEPVFNEPTKSIVNRFAGSPLNKFTASDAKPVTANHLTKDAKASQQSLPKSEPITFQSSVSFDPLVEAGKLPKNGQFLPVKEATNFHAPLINTPNFQQFNSLTTIPKSQNNFNGVQQASPQQAQIIQAQLVPGNSFFRPINNFNNIQIPNQQLPLQQQQQPLQQTQQTQLFPQQFQLPIQSFQQTQLSPQQSQQTPLFLQQQPLPLQQVQQQIQPQSNRFFRQDFGFGNFNGKPVINQQQNRFHRQESGTGNFLNNGFSIQQSSQPFPARHELGFFPSGVKDHLFSQPQNLQNNQNNRSSQPFPARHELGFFPSGVKDHSFSQPQNLQNNQNNRFFRNNLETTPQTFLNGQSNRFFRSNLEGTLTSPNVIQRVQPPPVNYQLNNLLLNSGFGGRSNEDLNIVTKVLSLNHGRNDLYRNVPLVK